MSADDKTAPKHKTREQWLEAAVEIMRPWLKDAGKPLPAKVRVSVGFPFGTRKAVGQCWSANAAKDKVHQVFVSPVDDDAFGKDGVLATLLHELCHAALPAKVGHRRPFQVLAGALGFTGPWKSTPTTPELAKRLNALVRELGAYPHAALSPEQLRKKKQGTRMIKCECEECGYTVRTTRKWLAELGAPRCAVKAHGQMSAELPDDDGEGEEE